MEARARAPRLPALTGIRIFAALAVYASHVGAPDGSPGFVKSFFTAGYCGVTLFFVLSGFVLAINYFDAMRHPSPGGTWNYFVARFARVYPLYVLVLFFCVVRQDALGLDISEWWRHALAIQAWDSDLGRVYIFDPPAWSISVEFFLYACFPLLIPLVARLRRPRGVLIAAGCVVAVMAALAAWFVIQGHPTFPWDGDSPHRWLYRMPLTRLGDFALGILAALLYFQIRERDSVARIGAPLAVGAGIVTVALMCWPELLLTPWSWDLAYAVPAALFIFGLALAPLSALARFFSLPVIVLLGEASYAFYLIHAPAINFLGAGGWSVSTAPSTMIYQVLVLGAILVMAIGLHMTVERPARVYIRRVLSRRKKAPPAPAYPQQGEPAPSQASS